MAIKKFNGNGRVIVRAISKEKINGKTYNPGDIIAHFDDVHLDMIYDGENKDATARGNKLNYNYYSPYSLRILNVVNTTELENLLYEIKNNSVTTEVLKIQKEKNMFSEGKIYLDVPAGSILKVETFSDGEKIEPKLNLEEGYITLDKKYKNVENFVFYNQIGTELALEKPEFGYLRVTAYIKGKLGNKDGIMILDVKKASLVTDPTFDFSEITYGTNLEFSIIDGEKSVVRFVE